MSPAYDSLTSVTEDLFDKVHATNARGPFRLSALIGERMAQGDGGSIINISSVGSWRPTATDLPYAMAKAALNALTLGLAPVHGHRRSAPTWSCRAPVRRISP